MEPETPKEEAPSLYPFFNTIIPLFFSVGALWELWHGETLEALLFLVLGISWTVMDLKREVLALHAHFHQPLVAVVRPNPIQEQSHD